jgi:hypothetical protein
VRYHLDNTQKIKSIQRVVVTRTGESSSTYSSTISSVDTSKTFLIAGGEGYHIYSVGYFTFGNPQLSDWGQVRGGQTDQGCYLQDSTTLRWGANISGTRNETNDEARLAVQVVEYE